MCFEKTNSYPSKGRNVTRAKRKKLNVCITGCGRSAYVRQKCDECVKIDNIKFRHRREERAAKGLCVRCGRHPAARGKKTCKSCLKSRRVKPHERKTVPMPEAQRTCGKCGAIGHRQSSKKCPQWKPNPNQHGFGRTTPVYRRTREVIRKAALTLSMDARADDVYATTGISIAGVQVLALRRVAVTGRLAVQMNNPYGFTVGVVDDVSLMPPLGERTRE